MSESSTESRRDALKIIGAVGATCAFPFSADELYGQTVAEHAAHGALKAPPVSTGPYTPVFFSGPELAVIARIADLIIPPTDTPGAIAAGVPQYIDEIVKTSTDLQKRCEGGIAWLQEKAGGDFLKLDEARQIALLTPLCLVADNGKPESPGEKLFHTIKSLTVDGYYTSYPGLVQELGYHGNTALASFPGCTHEH